jgi:hypothetical protein
LSSWAVRHVFFVGDEAPVQELFQTLGVLGVKAAVQNFDLGHSLRWEVVWEDGVHQVLGKEFVARQQRQVAGFHDTFCAMLKAPTVTDVLGLITTAGFGHAFDVIAVGLF